MVLWKEDPRGQVLFHPITSTYYQSDLSVHVDRNHLAGTLFVRFLYCKSTQLSPFSCTFWKEVTICSSHLKSRKLCFASLRVEYLHKLVGNLRRVFPTFCHLFNY